MFHNIPVFFCLIISSIFQLSALDPQEHRNHLHMNYHLQQVKDHILMLDDIIPDGEREYIMLHIHFMEDILNQAT
jgi:hypothetical protein